MGSNSSRTVWGWARRTGVLVVLALTPSAVRADCTHPIQSWSDFAAPLLPGSFSVPPVDGHRLPESQATAVPVPVANPVPVPASPGRTQPCFRCHGGREGTPPTPPFSRERGELLTIPLEQPFPLPWFRAWDFAAHPYTPDLADSIEHPPRTAAA
jgi:hypothetical protein